MMTNMYDRGLLDTGEYVVIYYDHETVDTIYPLKFYRSKLATTLNEPRHVISNNVAFWQV